MNEPGIHPFKPQLESWGYILQLRFSQIFAEKLIKTSVSLQAGSFTPAL
jgi:hypothetical protein